MRLGSPCRSTACCCASRRGRSSVGCSSRRPSSPCPRRWAATTRPPGPASRSRAPWESRPRWDTCCIDLAGRCRRTFAPTTRCGRSGAPVSWRCKRRTPGAWPMSGSGSTRAGRLPAQTIHPAVAASVVTARVRTDQLGEAFQFSGAAFGAEGTVSLGRVQLGLSYLQGRLAPDSGSAPARDLVEGSVLFGVRPAEWLTLSAGPHARAYAANGQTQRWVYWELRMRAAKPFIGTAVRGYAELWRAVSADANVPEPFDHAQGGEAGMIVRLARAPFECRVAYRIDHAVLGGGTRLETADGVVIGVGLAWR